MNVTGFTIPEAVYVVGYVTDMGEPGFAWRYTDDDCRTVRDEWREQRDRRISNVRRVPVTLYCSPALTWVDRAAFEDFTERALAASEKVWMPQPPRYLAHAVLVQIHEPRGGALVSDDIRFNMHVHHDGYVELDIRHVPDSGRREEATDYLVENDIAEWRRVGREDSELFLTRHGAEMLAGPIGGLEHEWHPIPEPVPTPEEATR